MTFADRPIAAAVIPTTVAPRSPAKYTTAPTIITAAPTTWRRCTVSPIERCDSTATRKGVGASIRLVVAAGWLSIATNWAPWVTA